MHYRQGPQTTEGLVKCKEGRGHVSIFSGEQVKVLELRGGWIRAPKGWLPLNNGRRVVDMAFSCHFRWVGRAMSTYLGGLRAT